MRCSVCNGQIKREKSINSDGSFNFKNDNVGHPYLQDKIIYPRCIACYKLKLFPVNVQEFINSPFTALKEKYPFLGVDMGLGKSFTVTHEHKPKDE